MITKHKFFLCKHCGNLVGMIDNAGVPMICCGEKMTELIPNTVDAAAEKHVPNITRYGEKVIVKVGEVPHPMTEEHHIAWVAVMQENSTFRVALSPTGEPRARACVTDGPVTVYAYCNLHGLWAASL
ncbi:MAG: desulfoferrodoxin [Clostridiales bacterium]|nr:desulfoferrodoxin [Clostridiales bacterium]